MRKQGIVSYWGMCVRVLPVMLGALLVSCAPQQSPSPITYGDYGDGATGRRMPSDMGEAQQPAMPATPSQTVKVALLLPLSGQSRELGNSMMDAAILALNDKYSSLGSGASKTRIILIPKDTKGDPSVAAREAEQAVKEGADIIVGPVFSRNLSAVAPLLRARGIPILSFSNNQAMAEPGVYLMGFLPEQQMRRVVHYAEGRGARRFAALLPSNAYGRMMHGVLQEIVSESGSNLANAIYYTPGTTNLSLEVKQLFAPVAPEEAKDGQMPMEPEVNRGVDALIVPEGGGRLYQLAQALHRQRVETGSLMILGSGQWDEDSAALPPELTGSWFASADPGRRQQFDRHFRETYGYEPVRLASLAYDATALVTTLAYSGGLQAERSGVTYFTPEVLTNDSGFNGPVDGVFRFHDSGKVERGLAVLEVGAGGFKVVDPAPRAFFD